LRPLELFWLGGRSGRDQRPELALDGRRYDRRSVRVQRVRERSSYFIPGARLDGGAPEAFGCRDYVQRRQIERRNIRRVLELANSFRMAYSPLQGTT
jgi:hypothetical protein